MKTLLILFFVSFVSLNSFAKKGSEGGGGGDPRVNAFLKLARDICDAKMLPQIKGAPLASDCEEKVQALTNATAQSKGGVGFLDKPVYDDNGFEKVCAYKRSAPVSVVCNGDLWSLLTDRNRKETVAIELGGLTQVTNRYIFGSQVRDLTDSDGSWLTKAPSTSGSCATSECELQARFEYYFSYATPTRFDLWETGAYRLKCLSQSSVNGYLNNWYGNNSPTDYWLYVNTAALIPIAGFGVAAHRVEYSIRQIEHLLGENIRRLDIQYDTDGSVLSTRLSAPALVGGNDVAFEFKTIRFAPGKTAILVKAQDSESAQSKPRWFAFVY